MVGARVGSVTARRFRRGLLRSRAPENLERIGAGAVSSEGAVALAVMMVGGQILARATRGSPMSSKVLVACRHAAKALLENHRP